MGPRHVRTLNFRRDRDLTRIYYGGLHEPESVASIAPGTPRASRGKVPKEGGLARGEARQAVRENDPRPAALQTATPRGLSERGRRRADASRAPAPAGSVHPEIRSTKICNQIQSTIKKKARNGEKQLPFRACNIALLNLFRISSFGYRVFPLSGSSARRVSPVSPEGAAGPGPTGGGPTR